MTAQTAARTTAGVLVRVFWEVFWLSWEVLKWSGRHAAWALMSAMAGAVAALFGGRDVGLIVLAVVWLVPAVGSCVWRRRWPISFERVIAGPARRRRWRKWARQSWVTVATRSGLGQTTQRRRSNLKGESWTEAYTLAPALRRVETCDTSLHLTARALVGQTSEDLAAIAPALRDAAGARSVATKVINPGVVRFELRMADVLSSAFSSPGPYVPSDGTVAVHEVAMGRREDSAAWILTLTERHTLVTGCAGSGKGSIVWGIVGNLLPAVAAGLVRLYAIDLKYGVEIKMGERAFTAVATTEEQALVLLERIDALVASRGHAMAGTARSHTPTVADPFVVLVIDELASLTAYMSDQDAKKSADRLLRSILSKGRAMGVSVVGAIQDPRKETLPARGLFTQTIALRLRSRDEVTMVLGAGMADSAPADKIMPTQQGMGYAVDEDGTAIRVRAAYWSDSLIKTAVARYPAPHVEGLAPTEGAPQTPGREEADTRGTARQSGSTSTATPGPGPSTNGSSPRQRAPRKPRTPRVPRTTGGTSEGPSKDAA